MLRNHYIEFHMIHMKFISNLTSRMLYWKITFTEAKYNFFLKIEFRLKWNSFEAFWASFTHLFTLSLNQNFPHLSKTCKMAKEVEKQKIYTIQLANVMEITSSCFLSYGSLIVFTRYCFFIFQCSFITRRIQKIN